MNAELRALPHLLSRQWALVKLDSTLSPAFSEPGDLTSSLSISASWNSSGDLVLFELGQFSSPLKSHSVGFNNKQIIHGAWKMKGKGK